MAEAERYCSVLVEVVHDFRGDIERLFKNEESDIFHQLQRHFFGHRAIPWPLPLLEGEEDQGSPDKSGCNPGMFNLSS